MSKRIPVYLNEDELKVLKQGLKYIPQYTILGVNLDILYNTITEKIESFDESQPFSNVEQPEKFELRQHDDNFDKKID